MKLGMSLVYEFSIVFIVVLSEILTHILSIFQPKMSYRNKLLQQQQQQQHLNNNQFAANFLQHHYRQRSESCCRELFAQRQQQISDSSPRRYHLSANNYASDSADELFALKSSGFYGGSSYNLNFSNTASNNVVDTAKHSIFRGWDRENFFNSIGRDRATRLLFKSSPRYRQQQQCSPIQSYRSSHTESEPLVPRPSFVFGARGQQCPPMPSSSPSPPPSYNSISAHELCRDIVNVFPNGSPYHQLRNPVSKPEPHQQRRSSRHLSNTTTAISYTTLTESSNVDCQRSTRQRRPLSVNLNDESYLNWSANTIVRNSEFYSSFFWFCFHFFLLLFLLFFFWFMIFFFQREN